MNSRLDLPAIYREHDPLYSNFQGEIPEKFRNFPKNGVTAYYLTDSRSLKSVMPPYNPAARLNDSGEVTAHWINLGLSQFKLRHKRLIIREGCRNIHNDALTAFFKNGGWLELSVYHEANGNLYNTIASKRFLIGRKSEGKPNFLMKTAITTYPASRLAVTDFSLRYEDGSFADRETQILRAAIRKHRDDLFPLTKLENDMCLLLLNPAMCRKQIADKLGLVAAHKGSMHPFNYAVRRLTNKFECITLLKGYDIEDIAKFLRDHGLL
jgi:hypothetical protein